MNEVRELRCTQYPNLLFVQNKIKNKTTKQEICGYSKTYIQTRKKRKRGTGKTYDNLEKKMSRDENLIKNEKKNTKLQTLKVFPVTEDQRLQGTVRTQAIKK